MAVIAVQDQTITNWLKMESYADLAYARKTMNFKGVAGTVYKHGTVVGTSTTLDELVPWDGVIDPVGMLYHTVTGTGANADTLVLFRGPAAVRLEGLNVPAGMTAAQMKLLRDALEDRGFEVLDSVDAEAFAY